MGPCSLGSPVPSVGPQGKSLLLPLQRWTGLSLGMLQQTGTFRILSPGKRKETLKCW